MIRKIEIPNGVIVNKIQEFNDEEGNPFLVMACQNGVLLTCYGDSIFTSEYQLLSVCHIIDI